MQLRDYTDADYWLLEALEGDPEVMVNLGGPTPAEKFPALHARRLKSVLEGNTWYFTICPNDETGPVGTIGIWDSEWKGAKITEMGWMILPRFQGRGYATKSGRMILERAKSENKCAEVDAFPAAINPASNAICRKLGFKLLGEVELS